MRVCKKCGEVLKGHITIDGKKHNVSRRLYCFKCSPFGKHNTRKIEEPVNEGKNKTCSRCFNTFLYRRHTGCSPTYCITCHSLLRRYNTKLRMVEYKGGKCEKCGYDKCEDALVFHHLDPSKKEMNFNTCYCRSWESIKKELDKSILLCSNCHSEIHKKRTNDDLEHIYKAMPLSKGIAKKVIEHMLNNNVDVISINENNIKQAKKEVKKCVVCNKSLVEQQKKYCSSICLHETLKRTERPTSEELQKLIWEKPTMLLAKDFGVSDKAIEKWCKSYGIEKPPRGYWNKVAAGIIQPVNTELADQPTGEQHEQHLPQSSPKPQENPPS